MGLNEKRKMKELQEITFVEREAELAEICGWVIPYNVDWNSFADDLEALNFVDNLSCHRTNMAFRVICADDLGREAVQESVTSIKLKNVKSKPEMRIAFEAGVLEMHCAYALHTDGMFSDSEIRDIVVQRL